MANEGKKEYVFTWEIENVSMCALETGEALSSPIFNAENLSFSNWHLDLYPKGEDDTCSDFISCFLLREQDDTKETIYYKMEVIGQNGEILGSDYFKKQTFDETNIGWGIPKFLSLDRLNEIMKTSEILTIRCHLLSESVPALGSSARTKIIVDRCCFKCNLKMDDSSNRETNQHIFFSEKSHLELTLTSSGDEFEIGIERKDLEVSKSKLVHCKISLINLKGKEVLSKNSEHLFKSNDALNKWKFPSFFSKKDLQPEMDDTLLDNEITLKFELSVSNGEISSEIKSIEYENPVNSKAPMNDSFSALLEDLRSMLNTPTNSDVKLRVEDQIIPAHRFILCARSPVFKAMFNLNMSENETGIVDIEDVDAKTLNSFLEFLYTGIVKEMDSAIAMKLMIAADKYQIPSLTEKCSAFLISKLCVENVCDVYAVGDLVNHACLRSSALKYMQKNSKNVLKSKFWTDCMEKNVKLANEILYRLALD